MMFFIKKRVCFGSFLIFITVLEYGTSVRIKDKMYENIDAASACFRRLNSTHQVGCSSKRGGSTGVIHFCNDQTDFDFILKNGTAPPYVPIISTELFTAPNLERLKQSLKISGLVLYANEPIETFSHEQQCPNPQTSLKNTCQGEKTWNVKGTGLLYQDIPFPVFYVEDKENLKFARECFEKFNNFSFSMQRDRALCSLELTSFMYATRNTQTCIRRSNTATNFNKVRFCDPLGSQNLWASLFPLVKNEIKMDYIVVVARLDATSMFEKSAGAISPVTGLVTLLSTAKLLSTILPTYENYKTNVLFVLFNGESYEYLGSQRFVYEMLQGNFPTKSNDIPLIQMEDIKLVVELSQLNNTGSVVAHYRVNPRNFLLKMHQNSRDLINLDEAEDSLPPASLHTFLKNRTDLPGVILTDHRTTYKNPYYNSVYDNATNLNYHYMNSTTKSLGDDIQSHIYNISLVLAQTIYTEITNQNYQLNASLEHLQLVDELLHCYLENANCRVHKAIQKMELGTQPLPLYVGVERGSHFATTLIGLTLAWLTGQDTGPGDASCTNEPRNHSVHYYNMSASLGDLNTTRCFRICMNFTDAVSPAFIIEDYDWSSGQYSTWAESTWGDIKLRIFLKPSAAHENMTIAIGSIVFIFSFLFVYFVKSRSHILFVPDVPTVAPTNC